MKNLFTFKLYLAKYKWRLTVVSLLIVFGALLEGLGIGLFFPLLEYVQKGEEVLKDSKFAILFDALRMIGVKPSVVSLMALIFASLIAILLSKYLITVSSAWTYNPLMKDIRDDGFKLVVHYPVHYYQSISSGKMVSIFIGEVEHVGQSLNVFIMLLTNAASILVFGLAALFISVKLTILAGFIAVARYLVSGLFIKESRTLGEMLMNTKAALNGYLIGVYQGIDLLKAYATETREEKRFESSTGDILTAITKVEKNIAASRFFEGILGESILCVLVYIAVATLALSPTRIFVFLYIMMRVIPKVQNINDSRIRLAEYTSSFGNLKKLFTDRSVKPLSWGNKKKESIDAGIAFEDIWLSYGNDEKYALQEINLEIERNTTVALVGESGSGKTTLTRLLLRLYDPSRGTVLVDGVPLNELQREDWRSLVSVVSQDTFIFDDTVENNIKYGVESCTEEDYQHAVKSARAEEFIDKLENGEKTNLGERGIVLSGGQRQRIAIARAFLRNSPILILDEATSALDSVTERLIQEALEELSKDRTMLVVAHRLSTIRHAHKIVVMDNGKIAEVGTHQELLDTGELYTKYHNLQLH